MFFKCNICGDLNDNNEEVYRRESIICNTCQSNVRYRSIMQILSSLIYEEQMCMQEFPVNKEISIMGMSDSPAYANVLPSKFNYLNTVYEGNGFHLDITNVPSSFQSKYNYVICADVLEHVPPPISRAFDGLFQVLKPGGYLILTVPYTLEKQTVEHFPNLHNFSIEEVEGVLTLKNTTKEGIVEMHQDLVFHGNIQSSQGALEMRVFCETDVFQNLSNSGFDEIRTAAFNNTEFGIKWEEMWSLPIIARKPLH